MPMSISCPACGAHLKAPDAAAGRTFRCPKCRGPVVVPDAPDPSADFAFDHGPTGGPDDDANPFADPAPADEPQTFDPDADDGPRKTRRPTAKKKPAGGFNPFDGDAGGAEPAAGAPPKKRRYRKDGDYNPFGDVPVEEAPDPAGEGFEFGVEAPPAAPAADFDFGPLDPRGDDDGPRRRRR